MSREYVAKSFRSGNSVAIRMPAALGIEPDREWTVTEDSGALHIRAKERPRQKLDISGFWGKCPELEPPPREVREFDERPGARERSPGRADP